MTITFITQPGENHHCQIDDALIWVRPKTKTSIFSVNENAFYKKENGQNPDSGSKNSENQNNDAVL